MFNTYQWTFIATLVSGTYLKFCRISESQNKRQ